MTEFGLLLCQAPSTTPNISIISLPENLIDRKSDFLPYGRAFFDVLLGDVEDKKWVIEFQPPLLLIILISNL